jgi:hypothetical protein
VKILLEEIVKRGLTDKGPKGPGLRYRRAQLGSYDVPVEMLPVLQDGFTLVMDDDDVDNNSRRSLTVANVRVAAIRGVAQGHIGLILDLIDPALYKALEEDQDAPADYEAFCKLEHVEP